MALVNYFEWRGVGLLLRRVFLQQTSTLRLQSQSRPSNVCVQCVHSVQWLPPAWSAVGDIFILFICFCLVFLWNKYTRKKQKKVQQTCLWNRGLFTLPYQPYHSAPINGELVPRQAAYAETLLTTVWSHKIGNTKAKLTCEVLSDPWVEKKHVYNSLSP